MTHTHERSSVETNAEKIFAEAVNEAGVAMKRWTNGSISMESDAAAVLPLDEALASSRLDESAATMAILTIAGDVGGDLVLAFDEENGRELCATLLGRPRETCAEWTPLEISAICETANILGCAYVNVLTRQPWKNSSRLHRISFRTTYPA
ncbi:MAG: hypothetical protein QM811_19260 [Pirellulales bacterium]